MPGKLKFVIADDDRMTRNVLRMLLHEGYHHIDGEACDGEKALELCIAHQPDIAFIDIDMPKLDGHEAKKIRENCKNTQLIVVSSLSTASNVQQAFQQQQGQRSHTALRQKTEYRLSADGNQEKAALAVSSRKQPKRCHCAHHSEHAESLKK